MHEPPVQPEIDSVARAQSGERGEAVRAGAAIAFPSHFDPAEQRQALGVAEFPQISIDQLFGP